MTNTIIGVIGGGNVDPGVAADAYQLGELIAERGWVLLNGGRDAGVMRASAAGAASQGGLVIGVLPGEDRKGMAAGVTIPIVTGAGSARNNINVLSSDVVIACQGGAGTLSEIALAIKAARPVIALNIDVSSIFPEVTHVSTPEEAINVAERVLAEDSG